MKSQIFIIFISCILLFSCKEKPAAALTPEQEAKKSEAAERFRNRQATGPMRMANETLQMIWPAYEQLRDALVIKDVPKAKEAAFLIAEGTKGAKGFSEVNKAAMQTILANDADKQRIYFSPMSNALIDMVRKAGMLEGKIFVAFCPMAFDDKGGYWLTGQRKIVNPYFGDEMLTCGSIEETISFLQEGLSK
jgi:hypothetical protein